MTGRQIDVKVENHGSVFLVRALSDDAREWLDENVSGDATYFGGALVVEHRYVEDLVQGIYEAGLGVT